MPEPKITYFPIRGRGEIPRMLLEVAGVEYEDVRLSFEEFQGRKPSLPFGQLPLYEDEEVGEIPQSAAIARHLARKFNFYGKNESEKTLVDVVVDGWLDVHVNTFAKYLFSPEYNSKKGEIKEALKNWLGMMQKLLQKNNGGNGYFVGDSLTLADFYAFNFLNNYVKAAASDVLDTLPVLKNYLSRLLAHPKLDAYIKSGRRPAITMPPGKAFALTTPVS